MFFVTITEKNHNAIVWVNHNGKSVAANLLLKILSYFSWAILKKYGQVAYQLEHLPTVPKTTGSGLP